MSTLPRQMVVAVCLILGVTFIFILHPPYSPCDSQYELLKESQKGFLYLDKKKKYMKTTEYEDAVKECKEGNSAGACAGLFKGIDFFMRDFDSMSLECQGDLSSKPEIRKFIWNNIELLAQLQWANYSFEDEDIGNKYGWYTPLHLRSYCEMKAFIKDNYKNAWNKKSNEILMSLPTQENMTKKDRFRRSLFSHKC